MRAEKTLAQGSGRTAALRVGPLYALRSRPSFQARMPSRRSEWTTEVRWASMMIEIALFDGPKHCLRRGIRWGGIHLGSAGTAGSAPGGRQLISELIRGHARVIRSRYPVTTYVLSATRTTGAFRTEIMRDARL